MATIDKIGFVAVKTSSSRSGRPESATKRNWWIGRKCVSVGKINIPAQHWGKRIQFKLYADGKPIHERSEEVILGYNMKDLIKENMELKERLVKVLETTIKLREVAKELTDK